MALMVYIKLNRSTFVKVYLKGKKKLSVYLNRSYPNIQKLMEDDYMYGEANSDC